jgi:hypothetical protein
MGIDRIDSLAGRNKNKTMKLFKAAIEYLPFLRSKKDNSATDYFSTIIVGEELHADLPEGDLVHSTHSTIVPVAVWGSYEIPFGRESTIPIWLKFGRIADTDSMNGFVIGDPNLAQWYSGETVKALNILISKAIYDQEVP